MAPVSATLLSKDISSYVVVSSQRSNASPGLVVELIEMKHCEGTCKAMS